MSQLHGLRTCLLGTPIMSRVITWLYLHAAKLEQCYSCMHGGQHDIQGEGQGQTHQTKHPGKLRQAVSAFFWAKNAQESIATASLAV